MEFQILLLLNLFTLICCKITQIHLSQGKDPTSMIITYISPLKNDSLIKYGTNPNKLNLKTYSNYTTYNYTENNIFYNSDYIYTGILENLKPNTNYYYKCTNSNIISFQTLPIYKPTIIGVLGDLGQTNYSYIIVDHIKKNKKLSMILYTGDLSYAGNNQTKWDTFGELIEKSAKSIPWMISPGNHEIEYSKNNSIYLAFEKRYRMPEIKSAKIDKTLIIPTKSNPTLFLSDYNYGNAFYSFNSGYMHVISLNSYSRSDKFSKQYKWLEKDLQKINREKTPWVFVIMHCPFYSSQFKLNDQLQSSYMRNYIEPLLYKYGVNIIFTGHKHIYERTHPIYRNKIDKNGIIYITTGNDGYLDNYKNNKIQNKKLIIKKNIIDHGYGELIIKSKDKLIWQWYSVEHNKYIDMVIINNKYFKNEYL